MGKKLQPKLRFKGFTDDWEQRKLGDILSYEQPYEYIVSSDDYSPVARTPVLTAGKTLILGYTNEADGIKAVTKDSPVIIFDDFTASSHIIDYSFKIKSSAMKILSLRDSENDLYCIYYALTRIIRPSASHERQWISKYARATVTIPSKDEQQVIGDFLRKLDRLIAAEKRKLDLLKDKKTALLRQIFDQKERFKGYTDPWEPRRLGDVAEIGTGSHNTQDGHLAGPYPFFIRSNQKLFLDDFDYDEEAILIPGDGRIGQIYHYMNGKYALHQRVYRIKVDSSVDTRFILYLMESRFRKHALAMNSQGTVPSLRKPIFTEWGINLPRDRDEQVRIGMLFSQLDNLIAAESRKIDLLELKKKALLQQMFV